MYRQSHLTSFPTLLGTSPHSPPPDPIIDLQIRLLKPPTGRGSAGLTRAGVRPDSMHAADLGRPPCCMDEGACQPAHSADGPAAALKAARLGSVNRSAQKPGEERTRPDQSFSRSLRKPGYSLSPPLPLELSRVTGQWPAGDNRLAQAGSGNLAIKRYGPSTRPVFFGAEELSLAKPCCQPLMGRSCWVMRGFDERPIRKAVRPRRDSLVSGLGRRMRMENFEEGASKVEGQNGEETVSTLFILPVDDWAGFSPRGQLPSHEKHQRNGQGSAVWIATRAPSR